MIVKLNKSGVMSNYWNIGIQREVRLLNSRSRKMYQGQPSCFGCHQNRNNIKIMKLDFSVEVKNIEA